MDFPFWGGDLRDGTALMNRHLLVSCRSALFTVVWNRIEISMHNATASSSGCVCDPNRNVLSCLTLSSPDLCTPPQLLEQQEIAELRKSMTFKASKIMKGKVLAEFLLFLCVVRLCCYLHSLFREKGADHLRQTSCAFTPSRDDQQEFHPHPSDKPVTVPKTPKFATKTRALAKDVY